MPKIQTYLNRGRTSGVGNPVQINRGAGQIRNPVGSGSLTSAVPQLRRRDFRGAYLDQGAPAQPLLSGRAAEEFASTMLNAVMTKVARDNKLRAKEAYFSYQDKRRELEQEFYGKTGKDAIDGHGEFQKRYEALYQESLESLNPGARELAMGRFVADRESTLTGAAKHVVSQRRTWEKDTQAEEVERSFLGLEKYTYDMAGAANYIRNEAALNFKLDTPSGRVKALKFSDKAWTTLFQMRLSKTVSGNAAAADADLHSYSAIIGDTTQALIQDRIEQAYSAERTQEKRIENDQKAIEQENMRKILSPIIDKAVVGKPLDDAELVHLKMGFEKGLITASQYKGYLDDNQELGTAESGFDSNLYIDLENRVIRGQVTDEDFALEVKTFPEKQRTKLYALRKSEKVKRYNRDFKIQTNRIQAITWGVPVNPLSGDMADRMFESLSQRISGERKALNVEFQTRFFDAVNDPEDKRSLREKADSIIAGLREDISESKVDALMSEYQMLSEKKRLTPWERERYNTLGETLRKHQITKAK